MESFLSYTKGKVTNSYSEASKFWKEQKDYTMGQVDSALPSIADISNIRRWKGRRAMGNNCTESWFRKSLDRITKAKVPIDFAKPLEESNYGNPYKATSGYGTCSGMFLLNIMNAYEICNYVNEYIQDTRKLDICEIGTGWGQMCEILNQIYDLKSYTSIDLEETLFLAYMNACHNYEHGHINLVDDENSYGKYNYCIPEKIAYLENKSYDIFINCFSFQEMSKKNVTTYISFIKRTLKSGGILVSINSCGRFEIDNFSDFGFHNFEMLAMKPALRVTPNIICPISCCVRQNKEYEANYDLSELDKKAKEILQKI